MRLITCSLAAATLSFLAGPLAAENAPDIVEAMRGEATPEIVKWVAAKDAKVEDAAAKLLQDPATLGALGDLIATDARKIFARDGAATETFVDWLLEIGGEARKKSPKEVAVLRAYGALWLAKARAGIAADKRVAPDCWIKAAKMLVESATRAGETQQLADAYMRALKLLHEGAGKEGAAVQRLYDAASVLGPKALEAVRDDEDLRRAVAESFKKQAYEMYEVSKRRMQAALRGYFDSFGPLVRSRRYDPQDAIAFNELITLGREEKLNLKEDYVSKRRTALRGLLAYELPETGNWSATGDGIEQGFAVAGPYRSIDFGVYNWGSVYRFKGAVRDCGGDNVKGVANLNYLKRLEFFSKIKKKKKPSRGKFNKMLPAGIKYSIEGTSKGGNKVRITGFFVKAVKAEKTIRILIFESAELTAKDPEKEAVYDSLDITKKSR